MTPSVKGRCAGLMSRWPAVSSFRSTPWLNWRNRIPAVRGWVGCWSGCGDGAWANRVRVDICGGELVILVLEVGYRRCFCDG